MRILALALGALLMALTGCATDTSKGAPPVAIQFGRGAHWLADHEGYDPELQGFWLQGAIGTVELKSGPHRPDRLVLRIVPPAGARPNLEHVELTTPTLRVQTFLANPGGEEVRELKDDRFQHTMAGPQPRYMQLRLAGNCVEVTLLPKAMEMVDRGALLFWIDYWRR